MLKRKLSYSVGIIGATGLIGKTLLGLLENSSIPINNLYLFASKKSVGKKIKFRNELLQVIEIGAKYYDLLDIVFFTTPSFVSAKLIPKMIEKDILIIDNSSYYRMMPNIPLVIPSINIKEAMNSKLVTNPNCSTIQAVIPLSIIKKCFGIKKIIYSSYQAVSGSGLKGIIDLEKKEKLFYPYPIWQTCIPEIGENSTNDFTTEEWKMINETKKILHLKKSKVFATCVRVPIQLGHGVAVYIETKKKIDYDKLLHNFEKAPQIIIKNDLKKHIYPTSIDTFNTDFVYIGRIRKVDKKILLFYCTANNLRLGAASNALKIAEYYIENL